MITFLRKSLYFGVLMWYLWKICESSHYRGAIITYEPTDSSNQVKITFRIAWRRSFSIRTFCNDTIVASGELIGVFGELICYSGCAGTLTDMTYQCTDYSIDEDWSAGQKSTVVSLPYTRDNTYIFGYTGGDWIPLVRGGGNWELRTTANLTPRAKTGRPNSSPVSAMPPIIRLQYGCNHSIEIPVTDVDGDRIRCRWAESSKGECGGVCKAFVDAVMIEETCTIYYFANGAIGWYGVTVQIEDFETGSNTNTDPLSSVPLQFLAQVFESNELCSSKPTLIGPTPKDGSCIGIPFNTIYRTTIVANASSKSDSIREINTVSPVGMAKSAVLPYGTTNTSYYINVTWSPMISQQGSHIFCFSAVNTARLSSDQTCVTLVVGVSPPKVSLGGFYPVGVVYPDHSLWYIEFDQQVVKSTTSSYINFHLMDGSLFRRIDVSTTPNVILSQNKMSLTYYSDFVLLEKQKYYITLDKGIVKGLLYCGIESDNLVQSWQFETRCRKGFWGNPSCINLCICNQLNTIDCDHNNGTCYCRTGWEGYDCNMDVNECRKPNVCPWNFDCVNMVGSYTCKCKPGFQLKQGKCISYKQVE